MNKFVMLLLLSVFFLSPVSAYPSEKGGKSDRGQRQSRLLELVSQLKPGDSCMSRFWQEVSSIETIDELTRKSLVKAITQADSAGATYQAIPAIYGVIALSRCAQDDASEIIEVLKNEKISRREFLNFLSGIGRAGPKAGHAKIPLKKLLNDPKTPLKYRASISAVLANIGETSYKSNVLSTLRRYREDVSAVLESSADPIDNNQASAALTEEELELAQEYGNLIEVLSLIHPSEWFDEKCVKELTAPLSQYAMDDLSDSPFWSEPRTFVLLGVLGKRAAASTYYLSRAHFEATKNRDFSAIWITFALIRVNPGMYDQAFGRLMKALPGIHERALPPAYIYLHFTMPDLMTTRIAKDLVTTLADKDLSKLSGEDRSAAMVVKNILHASSFAAHSAVPGIIKSFQACSNSRERSSLSEILLQIAVPAQLPLLKELIENESSEDVRKNLKRAVELPLSCVE